MAWHACSQVRVYELTRPEDNRNSDSLNKVEHMSGASHSALSARLRMLASMASVHAESLTTLKHLIQNGWYEDRIAGADEPSHMRGMQRVVYPKS